MTTGVSFIVPALDAGATLGACLDAILAARAPGVPREVLVLDNGSRDGTPDIARHRGVTVVPAPGLTVAALRNLGARLAQGDVLAFVDADCVIAPDWLEQALPHFDDPGLTAVGAPTDVPTPATWVQRTWALHRHRRNHPGAVSWLATENLLVRRSAFDRIGGFNEALATCEDVDLCYRLAAGGTIRNDPAIRSVHLGEAPTLARFFRKERWRGRGNLPGFLAHRFHPSELPSVALPVAHLAGLVALAVAAAVALLRGPWWPPAVATACLLAPSTLAAVRTARPGRRLRDLPPLVLVYLTYAAARTAALWPGPPASSRPARYPAAPATAPRP